MINSEGKWQPDSLPSGKEGVEHNWTIRYTTAVGKQYTNKSASGKFDLNVFAYWWYIFSWVSLAGNCWLCVSTAGICRSSLVLARQK
jgi:hypothetical protein